MALRTWLESGVLRRSSDVCQQFATVERFDQERDGAIPQYLLSNVVIIVGRDDNDRQQTPLPSNPPLQFRSIHAGQTHVCDDA